MAREKATPTRYVPRPRSSVPSPSPREFIKAGTALRLEWLAGFLAIFFIGGHLLLLSWWMERKEPIALSHDTTVHLEKGDSLERPHLSQVDEDSSAAAAVDEILASRGDEPRVRKPLANLQLPSSGLCVGMLPKVPIGGCPEDVVKGTLGSVFQKHSGFWAADAAETSILEQAATAGGGPKGFCAEATYGEITVEGLRVVLTELAGVQIGVPAQAANIFGHSFDSFIDLGAGVGQTAAAAALLGFSPRALGVELGPQRFALGCEALAEYNRSSSAGHAATAQICSRLGHRAVLQPTLKLVRGDARAWPELAAKSGWPQCSPLTAIYMGAECFRDSLVLAIGRALLLSCAAGARVAVLGRRVPAELVSPKSTGVPSRWLIEVKSLRAKTSWSDGAEVFLYVVAEGSGGATSEHQ